MHRHSLAFPPTWPLVHLVMGDLGSKLLPGSMWEKLSQEVSCNWGNAGSEPQWATRWNPCRNYMGWIWLFLTRDKNPIFIAQDGSWLWRNVPAQVVVAAIASYEARAYTQVEERQGPGSLAASFSRQTHALEAFKCSTSLNTHRNMI